MAEIFHWKKKQTISFISSELIHFQLKLCSKHFISISRQQLAIVALTHAHAHTHSRHLRLIRNRIVLFRFLQLFWISGWQERGFRCRLVTDSTPDADARRCSSNGGKWRERKHTHTDEKEQKCRHLFCCSTCYFISFQPSWVISTRSNFVFTRRRP